MKLSIVIPVYRVETTLKTCVESILTQSYTDFEMILVNDGSPDNCPQLCDEWKEKDRRIRVIHQKNQGLSAARNAGIEIAIGHYITFVDSDDMIAPDTLQPLMNELAQNLEYDILEYPVRRFVGSPKESLLETERKVYCDMWEYWLEAKAYTHAYAWNKIYKRKLFQNVKFPEGKVFEDVYTLPLLLQKAQTVATTNCGLYLYNHNPKGITATADGTALNQLLMAHMEVLKEWKASNRPVDKHFRDYYAHVVNIQIDVCETTGASPILPHFNTQGAGRHLKLWIKQLVGIKGLCLISKYLHKIMR